MKFNISIPQGYQVLTEDAKAQATKRNREGAVVLEINEVLEPQMLVSSVTKNKHGHYQLRILCGSSVKSNGRLIPINTIDCYPTDRAAFLSQTRFGRDLLEFSGNDEQLATWVSGKLLRVVKIEKLACKVFDPTFVPTADQKYRLIDGSRPFTLFDYAE